MFRSLRSLNRLKPVFKEEQEWRIIYTPIIAPNNGSDSDVIGGLHDYDFRPTKHGISPFFRWPFTSRTAQPIQKNILGPQNETNINSIRLLLHKYNIIVNDKNIKRSTATYRD